MQIPVVEEVVNCKVTVVLGNKEVKMFVTIEDVVVPPVTFLVDVLVSVVVAVVEMVVLAIDSVADHEVPATVPAVDIFVSEDVSVIEIVVFALVTSTVVDDVDTVIVDDVTAKVVDSLVVKIESVDVDPAAVDVNSLLVAVAYFVVEIE
jgi:hypothetical protein